MSDFYEDGENRCPGYHGDGYNKLGLRDREDEVVHLPHNTPGARGHILYGGITQDELDRIEKTKRKGKDRTDDAA